MITLIAAIAENNAIGKDNKMLWHLPADLKRFKKVTLGHPIIMGRKTFESLGKPLPKRTNIVISRNKNYQPKNWLVANSLREAVEIAYQIDENPFVIGGAEIYRKALKIADKLDITFVHHAFNADTFFPKIDFSEWKEIARTDYEADEQNPYNYSFVSYLRA